MADFCLPRKEVARFVEAIKSGVINPEVLRHATSSERREVFGKVLGDDLAHEVNALFESKLLLADQKTGLNRWANQLRGIPEPVRKNIIDQINGLGRVLNPRDKRRFLEDLAEQRLGAKVTADEAKELFDLSIKTTTSRLDLQADPYNLEKQEAYGLSVQDLTERMDQLKGSDKFNPKSIASWYKLGLGISGIPRELMSNFDLSAPFVQLWGLMSTKPFWESFAPMVKAFANEESSRRLNAQIIGHPDYKFAVAGDIGLTANDKSYATREEQFQTNLLNKGIQALSDYSKDKTGFAIVNPLRASERAFTGAANYARFYRFVDILNAARLAGEDVSIGISGPSAAVRDAGRVVRNFSGRSHIGPNDSLANLTPLANNVFFSTRKNLATIQMFNPELYIRSSPTARKAAIRQLAGSIIMTGTVFGLIRMGGGDVDLDPRSQNFGKARLPGSDTYFDFTGTNGTYIRLLARMYTGQKISSSGKLTELGPGFKSETRASEIGSFVRNKLSPMAGVFANSLFGSDPVGRPFDVSEEIARDLVPMTVSSFFDFYNSDRETAASAVMSLSSIFGVGMQPVHFTPAAYGVNVWGHPSSLSEDRESRILDDAAEEAKYSPRLPPNTINGVTLTKEQHKDYIILSGLITKQFLLPVVQSPGWVKETQDGKQQKMKDTIGMARTFASQQLQAKYKDLAKKTFEKGNK